MVGETVAVKKAEPNRINFTPLALKRLPLPEPREDDQGRPVVTQRDYWDSTVRGFGLRVSSTGTRTWVMFSRVPKGGQQVLKRFSLGRYAEREGDGGLTLAEARRKADEYRISIQGGKDPDEAKEQERRESIRRSGQTFGKVAEEFLTTHHPRNKKTLKPSTLRRYKLVLNGPDLADWRERPIASITRADVLYVIRGMRARGLGASCNRALATVRTLMHWAIQKDLIETAPTDHIKPVAAEVPRERHLFGDAEHNHPSELALLWRACDEAGTFGALPQVLLLNGQRRDEVTGTRGDELIELDGKNARWSIPGTRTKNGKRHLVPLTPAAVEIIQNMPRVAKSDLIFTTTGKTPFSGFSNLKEKIDRSIEQLKKEYPAQYARQFVEPWTFHDLRRTVKTGLAELGVRPDVRDAILNHSKQGVDKHYDHSQLNAEKRAALKMWEGHILKLVRADKARVKVAAHG